MLCPPNGRPIESSTNARVMDPLDRTSRWQRKVLPQKWVMARRFKGRRRNLEILSVSQRRLAAYR